ncbi:MAG: tRNA (N(6)-L-threonylcarbamoyladenosine(37)-C(2))-methylthiotransferase MtaB [Bacteroidales bacterium]|nr:tRNA (N(6)-L-threonylcarbamoyladenosine(37)-C(2))-methylthiotransferase MtaB [Bacteroidales bacterium]
MKVAFVTLGCKLNYAETSRIERDFVQNGHEVVPHTKKADLYVVNTCSVTEHSNKKCRNIINRLHRLNPDARIAVTGCYAQLKGEEILAMEGVCTVVGIQDKGRLLELATSAGEPAFHYRHWSEVDSFVPAYSSGERTRAFLKVQDGCDYHCAYCTVPLARGGSRNAPVSVLVEQTREIAEQGILEVVVTGVNTGDFGKSTGETFLDLLKALTAVPGIERWRISSIEPNLLTPEIIDWIATGTKKVMPHFHIPLQSGCDTVLKRMRRRYTTAAFADKIALVRERLGDVFFGIDVIVGFPGESEALFQETLAFLEKIRPAFIHIFPYSIRPDTPAAEFPDQVSPAEKDRRVKVLESLCERLHTEYIERHKGCKASVLFESRDKGGIMYGYTENYIRIERPYNESKIGRICEETI